VCNYDLTQGRQFMWETSLIETERGAFEVFKKGDGKPLCVTHLYSEFNKNGSLFANSFSHRFTIYLVNLAGCGNSTAGIGEHKYSMESAVKDLEAIRIALGIENWSFAGHSTGGMLGLKYAIQSPEALNSIIVGGLSASNAYMNHPGSIYCKENFQNSRILEILHLLGNPSTVIEERRAISKEWTMMSLHKKEAYDEMINRPNSGKTMSARLDYYSYVELPTYDLRPDLPGIELPVYLYSGVYDAQCPHDFGVEAAALIPNCHFTEFQQSNHFPYVEEEEEFLKLVETIV
jgi:proline iminopeptidase